MSKYENFWIKLSNVIPVNTFSVNATKIVVKVHVIK